MTDTILMKVQYADVSLESQTIPVPMPPNMPEQPIPPLPPRAIIYYCAESYGTQIQLRSCKNAARTACCFDSYSFCSMKSRCCLFIMSCSFSFCCRSKSCAASIFERGATPPSRSRTNWSTDLYWTLLFKSYSDTANTVWSLCTLRKSSNFNLLNTSLLTYSAPSSSSK